jgi:hypothetical protein
MKVKLLLLILAIAQPASARSKKPTGEVSDRQGFAAVRSYCVDTRGLPDDQLYEVEGFLREESKPKRLLTKLSWKLIADCREAEPNAVVKVEFVQLKNLGVALGEASRDQIRNTGEPPYRVKAVLQVADATSARLLYKVQAMPLDNSSVDSPMMADTNPVILRRDALYNAFSALIQDFQRVASANSK